MPKIYTNKLKIYTHKPNVAVISGFDSFVLFLLYDRYIYIYIYMGLDFLHKKILNHQWEN